MMLMGLVRRSKETGALFASDIKGGSERSSLLQSQQEEEPMHNAPLWTENIRAVRLLTHLTASIPLPQSPLCLTATMRRGRPVGGGADREEITLLLEYAISLSATVTEQHHLSRRE